MSGHRDPHTGYESDRAFVRRGTPTAEDRAECLRREAGPELMFAVLIRAAESWRGLRFTEFELRQLDVVRKELDADDETSIATKLPPPSRLST